MDNAPMHTPGPWEIRKSAHYRLEGVSHREIIIDPNGEEGGIVLGEVFYSDTGDEEAEANARLIAAAPELLDILENLIIGIGMGWDLDGIVEAAQAAIAKATKP